VIILKQRRLDEETTTRFGARIDKQLHQALRDEAYERDWSLNLLVEKILQQWIDSDRTLSNWHTFIPLLFSDILSIYVTYWKPLYERLSALPFLLSDAMSFCHTVKPIMLFWHTDTLEKRTFQQKNAKKSIFYQKKRFFAKYPKKKTLFSFVWRYVGMRFALYIP